MSGTILKFFFFFNLILTTLKVSVTVIPNSSEMKQCPKSYNWEVVKRAFEPDSATLGLRLCSFCYSNALRESPAREDRDCPHMTELTVDRKQEFLPCSFSS